ncbi:MAG: YfdX family protein [Chlorobi bacterium]|nr:YfdX family protein [Chlorobiota bacterium]
MKKSVKFFVLAALVLSLALTSCNENKNAVEKTDKAIPQKEALTKAENDSINQRMLADVKTETEKRKSALTEEALSTILETQTVLKQLIEGNKDDAIKKGKELIGNLEVLLAKDPSLELIPVNVELERNETVADIETVRENVKLAKEAMAKGYYREASKILDNMKSEIVINTYLIPAATYPVAIRDAVAAMEQNDTIAAANILTSVLGTVVIEKNVIPIPVLNAEQMVIEAASIDAESHDKADEVINLLDNAEYQLQLAEEMGYGKKDRDYAPLNDAIKELKKSVKNKEDSSSKFDSLKESLKEFKKYFFENKKK